jgi:hypothetical protein
MQQKPSEQLQMITKSHSEARPNLQKAPTMPQSRIPLAIKRENSQTSLDEALNNSNCDITERIALCADYKPAFRGSLEMIIGPMFAGKSTELLRRMQRHEISGKKCLYIKYSGDTRYSVSNISTHDQ